MLKPTFIVLTIGALALSACATKRYGRLQPLSSVEQSEYSCRDIAIEISKVEEFESQIEDGTKTNTKSVLGVLGDFGIGNTQEKKAARKTANARLAELEALKSGKNCDA